MTFFNSIGPERKVQIINSRIDSLKEQLWMILLDAGVDTSNFDVDTFAPETDINSENSFLRIQYTQVLDSIKKMQHILAELNQ